MQGKAFFTKELLGMYAKEIKEQFKGMRKLRQGLGKPCRRVRLKDKFAALLEGSYEDTIVTRYAEEEIPEGQPKWVQYRHKRDVQRRQEALLRLRAPEFVRDLTNIAKRWGLGVNSCEIDVPGFWNGHSPGLMAWHTVLEWASDKWAYEHIEDRRRQMAEIVEELSESYDFAKLLHRAREMQSQLPKYRFADELADFCRGYGLSALWDRSVEAFLVSGVLPVPDADCRMVVRPTETGSRAFLEVFPETRRRDLEEKWRDASAKVVREAIFPDQSKRRRVRDQLERDAETLRNLSQGRTVVQIAGGIGPEDLPEPVEIKLREALRKGSERYAEALSEAAEPLDQRAVPEWLERRAVELWESDVMPRERELYF